MLFNNRKKKREQELIERDHLLTEKQFSADIQKAGQIKDPAERLVALQYISNDIQAQFLKEDRDIFKHVEQSGKKTRRRVGWGSVAGGLTALVLVAHPVGWGILAGGAAAMAIGSSAAGSARETFVEKQLTKEAAGHSGRLSVLQALVDGMIEETLVNNVEVIKKSPLYEQVKDLYGISEEFSASAQSPAQKGKKAPVAKEAPAKGILRKNQPKL